MYFSALGESAMPSAREWRTVRRVRRPFAMGGFLFLSCGIDWFCIIYMTKPTSYDVHESWPLMSVFSRELRVIQPTVRATISAPGQKRARQGKTLAHTEMSA